MLLDLAGEGDLILKFHADLLFFLRFLVSVDQLFVTELVVEDTAVDALLAVIGTEPFMVTAHTKILVGENYARTRKNPKNASLRIDCHGTTEVCFRSEHDSLHSVDIYTSYSY